MTDDPLNPDDLHPSEANPDALNSDALNPDALNPDALNPDDLFEERMNWELESLSMNQLNDLGNRAVKLGLIIGHGYHGGQYELLHRTEAVLLPPNEALSYLEDLIQNAGG